MEIEMKIKGLVIDPISKMPIVVLEDIKKERMLPIWIGVFEANAISLKMEEVHTPRPMTHDLIMNFLHEFGATMEKIVVTDVRDNTFYANIHCRRHSQTFVIDSRPSDAIALSLRMEAPVFVEEGVVAFEGEGRGCLEANVIVFYQDCSLQGSVGVMDGEAAKKHVALFP